VILVKRKCSLYKWAGVQSRKRRGKGLRENYSEDIGCRVYEALPRFHGNKTLRVPLAFPWHHN
jgi:hypothetical protein